MRNNETGEFELVLGNRQLLGGFFIVIILFSVFFSMGYILGRNSAPMARVVEAAPAPVAAAPAAQPQPVPAQPEAAAEAKPENAEPQPTTQPVQQEGEKAAAPPPQPAATEPLAGETYLQVMAVKRPEAEVVMKTLKDKGFPVVMGPGPNELMRVLVGPYKDTAGLGQAKASLENAGFHPWRTKWAGQ